MNWSEMNQKQRQNLIRLALLALLGVVLVVAGGGGDDKNRMEESRQIELTKPVEAQPENTVRQMEQHLEQTLMQIKDAGQVTVQITVNTMGRKEYACDTQITERQTTEKNGGTVQETRETQEQRSVVQQAGQQGALLIEETMPEISGVLIVASGAEQAVVQEQLLQAASTVLQVSADRIAVLPGSGGDLHESV